MRREAFGETQKQGHTKHVNTIQNNIINQSKTSKSTGASCPGENRNVFRVVKDTGGETGGQGKEIIMGKDQKNSTAFRTYKRVPLSPVQPVHICKHPNVTTFIQG